MEVFSVNVESVLHSDAERVTRIFVGACEVAHIDEPSEVGVINSGHNFLNAFGVLAEESVVFYHGADIFGCGVFGDSAASFNDRGQSVVESSGALVFGEESESCVVAHTGCADNFGEVDLMFNAFDFSVEVAVGSVDKVCADGKIGDLESCLVAC